MDDIAIRLKCAEIAHVASSKLDVTSDKKIEHAKRIYDFVMKKTEKPSSQSKTGG